MKLQLLLLALVSLFTSAGRLEADVRTVIVDATSPLEEFAKKYRISIEKERGRRIIVLSYSPVVRAEKTFGGADTSEDDILEGCWISLAATDGVEALNAPVQFSKGADGRYSARIISDDRSVGRLTVTMEESLLQGGRSDRTYYQIHFKNIDRHAETEQHPVNSSSFQVELKEITGVNTRRFSCGVVFEVVEVIHDAFASTPEAGDSPLTVGLERSKQGAPFQGMLSARIYSGSDLQDERDSITRLLDFFGAKNVDEYVRHQGPFEFAKREKLLMRVTHSKNSVDIRWELKDQEGRRVIIRPFKRSR